MATVFVGGSALLLAGAMAALFFGFANGEDSLVWAALIASAAAAVLLVVAYFASRREMTAARKREAVTEMVGDTGTATAASADPATGTEEASDAREETSEAAAEPSEGTVVAVVSRKKFHRPDCRYASSEGAESMTHAEARRRGFSPCGICKP